MRGRYRRRAARLDRRYGVEQTPRDSGASGDKRSSARVAAARTNTCVTWSRRSELPGAGGHPALRLSAAAPEAPRPHPPRDPARPAGPAARRRRSTRRGAPPRASTAATSTATPRCSPSGRAIDDVHARYAARVELVEAALRAAPRSAGLAGDLPRRRRARRAAGGASRASRCCSTTPASPSTSWGRSSAARRCSRPRAGSTRSCANVARNLDADRAPPRGAARAAAAGDGSRARCRELARKRGERVAARARPAEGLRLSLCMIVKDEEEMLPRCLAAAAPPSTRS